MWCERGACPGNNDSPKPAQLWANEKVVDPTPILVLALLAAVGRNAFVGARQQIIRARFRGAAEEEEISP